MLFYCYSRDRGRGGFDRGGGRNVQRPPYQFDQRAKQEKGSSQGSFQGWDISPTDKVVHSEYSLVPKNANNKPTKDFSLGLIFPGECFELKKDIQNIFKEEFTKSCNSSKSFKDCFATSTIGALFKNEKKMGAIISKSKL